MFLELPWPPSINSYWRHSRGRHYISKAGKAYRALAGQLVMVAGQPSFGDRRLELWVDAYPPDNRPRDLDNILKCLVDSLESAGVFNNDSQLDALHVIRHEVSKPGRVQVEIRTFVPVARG